MTNGKTSALTRRMTQSRRAGEERALACESERKPERMKTRSTGQTDEKKLSGRLWRRVSGLLGRGAKELRARIASLLVSLRSRRSLPGGSGRPLRVVDQISAGPKLRLILLDVEGERVLLAASGDQVPGMLMLPGTRAHSIGKHGDRAVAHRRKQDESTFVVGWKRGKKGLLRAGDANVAGWTAKPIAGSDIQ